MASIRAYACSIRLSGELTAEELVTLEFEQGVPGNDDLVEIICHELDIDTEELLDFNEVSSCPGCRMNQPNQLAHSEYGGCLYAAEVDEAQGAVDGGDDSDNDAEEAYDVQEPNEDEGDEQEDNASTMD